MAADALTRCPTRVGIGLLLLAAGCGDPTPATCVEGTTQSCACAGGASGVQACTSEGRFGACECAAGDGGVSDAGPTSSSVMNGASGGTIQIDGARLEIPAGALSDDTLISVTRLDDPVPSEHTGLSPLFELLPDGLSFFTPATLTLDYVGDRTVAALFLSTSGGTYERLASVAGDSSVSGPLEHFSRAFVGEGLADRDFDAIVDVRDLCPDDPEGSPPPGFIDDQVDGCPIVNEAISDWAVRDLSVGQATACAVLASDGSIRCWGAGNDTAESVIGGAPTDGGWAEVAVTDDEGWACATRDDGGTHGTVTCWGDSFSLGTVTLPATGQANLEGGSTFVCGNRTIDNRVTCWGNGVGDWPTPPLVTSIRIAPTSYGGCSLTNEGGTVACWGGDNMLIDATPGPFDNFRDVATNAATYACALRDADGSVQCWGEPPRIGIELDVPVPAAGPFDRIVGGGMGRTYFCGYRPGMAGISCWWGAADPAFLQAWMAPEPTGVAFDEIQAAPTYMCGVRSSDRRVQCWGVDEFGAVTFRRFDGFDWF